MTPQAQAQLLDRLEREHGKSVRQAFEKAVRELRGRVNVSELTRMIAAGNVEGVFAAVGIAGSAGTAVYRDLETELVRAFESAGRAFTGLLPKNVRSPQGLQVRFAFDMRHPEAERWLQREAAGLVTRIVEDQREAIRQALSAGLEERVNPRTTALRIAGRMDRATKRRVGGIIGLSEPQTRYLANARSYLAAGDSRYFDLRLRDKRLDGSIRSAMEAGRTVPAGTRERALTRYADRMVKQRADTIAQTETLNSLRAGKHQAFTQGAEAAGVSPDLITRVWDATGDGRTRTSHALADGQTVQGPDTPFTVGGFPMRWPGDTGLGAPASETVRCRCMEFTRIDFVEAQARREEAA